MNESCKAVVVLLLQEVTAEGKMQTLRLSKNTALSYFRILPIFRVTHALIIPLHHYQIK